MLTGLRYAFVTLAMVVYGWQGEAAPLLNPSQVKGAESLNQKSWTLVNEPTQSEWIATALESLVLSNAQTTRHSLYDAQGETLDAKIKTANKRYLELNYAESLAAIEDASQMIASSLPFGGMRADIVEVAALNQMMSEDSADGDPSFDPRAFFLDRDFLERLPEGIRERLKATDPKVVSISPSDLGIDGPLRILVYGKESDGPLRLIAGATYFVHLFSKSKVIGAWLTVKDNRPHLKQVWSRDLWQTMPVPSLTLALKRARPAVLRWSEEVGVLCQTSDGLEVRSFRLQGPSKPFSKPTASEVQPPPLPSQSIPFDDFGADHEEKNRSILKSPWFWVLTGAVLAGVTGYIVYETTRETRIIETP